MVSKNIKKSVVDMHVEGLKTRTIAEKLGVKMEHVQYILRCYKDAKTLGIELNVELNEEKPKSGIFGIFK